MNEVTGIVKKVEKINEYLSFFSLLPHPATAVKSWDETRIPVYVRINQDYTGLPVNIFTRRRGFLRMSFEQIVNTPNSSVEISMPYWMIKRINNSYRQQ